MSSGIVVTRFARGSRAWALMYLSANSKWGVAAKAARSVVCSWRASAFTLYVVTALCSHHACAPFSLIQVEDYALRGQNSR